MAADSSTRADNSLTMGTRPNHDPVTVKQPITDNSLTFGVCTICDHSGHADVVKPLPGMEPIAEYATRWEANVALARLSEAGYEAVVLVDPATDVAPHHVTDRVAVLVVRCEAAQAATEVLGLDRPDREAEALDAAFHQQRFADRPAWVRFLTWTLVAAIPGPLAIVGLWLLLTLLRSLFP